MTQYRQNGRTGSFLAVNNGTVEGCIADIAFSCKNVGAGFVYENNARIISSASVRCIKGKLAKGFYVRNGGTITASGYIAGKGALRVGKDGKAVYVFGNEEQFIAGDTPAEASACGWSLTGCGRVQERAALSRTCQQTKKNFRHLPPRLSASKRQKI